MTCVVFLNSGNIVSVHEGNTNCEKNSNFNSDCVIQLCLSLTLCFVSLLAMKVSAPWRAPSLQHNMKACKAALTAQVKVAEYEKLFFLSQADIFFLLVHILNSNCRLFNEWHLFYFPPVVVFWSSCFAAPTALSCPQKCPPVPPAYHDAFSFPFNLALERVSITSF